MNRYKRQHPTPNMSKGFYWLLMAAVASFIMFLVLKKLQKMNAVREWEKQEINSKNPDQFILIDSTSRHDTVSMEELMEINRKDANSVSK